MSEGRMSRYWNGLKGRISRNPHWTGLKSGVFESIYWADLKKVIFREKKRKEKPKDKKIKKKRIPKRIPFTFKNLMYDCSVVCDGVLVDKYSFFGWKFEREPEHYKERKPQGITSEEFCDELFDVSAMPDRGLRALQKAYSFFYGGAKKVQGKLGKFYSNLKDFPKGVLYIGSTIRLGLENRVLSLGERIRARRGKFSYGKLAERCNDNWNDCLRLVRERDHWRNIYLGLKDVDSGLVRENNDLKDYLKEAVKSFFILSTEFSRSQVREVKLRRECFRLETMFQDAGREGEINEIFRVTKTFSRTDLFFYFLELLVTHIRDPELYYEISFGDYSMTFGLSLPEEKEPCFNYRGDSQHNLVGVYISKSLASEELNDDNARRKFVYRKLADLFMNSDDPPIFRALDKLDWSKIKTHFPLLKTQVSELPLNLGLFTDNQESK